MSRWTLDQSTYSVSLYLPHNPADDLNLFGHHDVVVIGVQRFQYSGFPVDFVLLEDRVVIFQSDDVMSVFPSCIRVHNDEVSRGMNVGEWDVVNQSAGGLKVRRVGATGQSITLTFRTRLGGGTL